MEKISQLFKEYKLSINIKKTKFALFHKNFSKNEIPVKLPALIIRNNSIERKSSIKFLEVILYEHINPIQDGPFRGYSRMGGQKAPLPKVCHTYPTMMKLGPVVPYLKNI